MRRLLAVLVIASISLPNLTTAQEVPPPPSSDAASPEVPALFPMPVAQPSVVHTTPVPTSASNASPAVVDAVQRAEAAAQQDDRRGAQLALREAQRAERDSPALRVARIALGHRLLPGVALRLDVAQLEEVIGHDHAGSINHTLGHVFGIVGAVGGAVAVLLGVLAAIVSGGSGSGAGLAPAIGAFGGGGLAFALVGILFHVAGSSNDGDASAILQLTPTSSGASLTFSARY